jgi:hypothetical protein
LHRAVDDDEAQMLLFEPASTLDTAAFATKRAREELQRSDAGNYTSISTTCS